MTTLPEHPARVVHLRPASIDDARLIWNWRNEDAVRAASFSTAEVPWDVHQRWFSARLRNPACRLFIAHDGGGRNLGFVRFDCAGRTAEISVALDVTTRGQGWGRVVIRQAAERLVADGSADHVIAHVRTDNPASLAAFTAAGFVSDGPVVRGDVPAWALHFAAPGGSRA